MKPRVAHLDSFNFSSSNLEVMFLNRQKYSIEVVKSVGVFEPQRWFEVFGRNLTRNIIEAKILHTHTGLTLAIKRYASSPHKQTLEFAGLHGYTDKSKYLNELLKELWEHIQDDVIARIDIAIDFRGNTPTRVIKALQRNRKSFQWKNTTYMKTDKEKKSNSNINICRYPKHKKNNSIDYEMERLEFSFRSAYFRGIYKVINVEDVYKKIEKTIKRLAGIDIDIQAL